MGAEQKAPRRALVARRHGNPGPVHNLPSIISSVGETAAGSGRVGGLSFTAAE